MAVVVVVVAEPQNMHARAGEGEEEKSWKHNEIADAEKLLISPAPTKWNLFS